jgi:hypothetical protein
MRSRRSNLSPEYVAALNTVEVEFAGVKPIENAQRELLTHLNSNAQANPVEWMDRVRRLQTRLPYAMANYLGYGMEQRARGRLSADGMGHDRRATARNPTVPETTAGWNAHAQSRGCAECRPDQRSSYLAHGRHSKRTAFVGKGWMILRRETHTTLAANSSRTPPSRPLTAYVPRFAPASARGDEAVRSPSTNQNARGGNTLRRIRAAPRRRARRRPRHRANRS